MKLCARCKTEKPKTAFYASHRFSDGLRTWCKECDRAGARGWNVLNPDRRRVKMRAWREANADHDMQYRKSYYENNRESIIAKSVARQRSDPEGKRRRNVAWKRAHIEQNRAIARRWGANNVERNRAKARAWYVENAGRAKANARLRETRERRAMPKWANRFFIGEIYDLAKLRTKMVGEPWHVDHIVPLVSPTVCGLHVEHNLQVIPARVNRAKSNSHWPDKP